MGCCGGEGNDHDCECHDEQDNKHNHEHSDSETEEISVEDIVYNNDVLLDSVIHLLIEKKVFTEEELLKKLKEIEDETEDDVEVSEDDE